MTQAQPQPPWVRCPGEISSWAGWKQGAGYTWMLSVFMPFWRAADAAQRETYLAQWPPPGDDWRWWIAQLG